MNLMHTLTNTLGCTFLILSYVFKAVSSLEIIRLKNPYAFSRTKPTKYTNSLAYLYDIITPNVPTYFSPQRIIVQTLVKHVVSFEDAVY